MSDALSETNALQLVHVMRTSMPPDCLLQSFWHQLPCATQQAFRRVSSTARSLVDNDLITQAHVRVSKELEGSLWQLAGFLGRAHSLRTLSLMPLAARFRGDDTTSQLVCRVLALADQSPGLGAVFRRLQALNINSQGCQPAPCSGKPAGGLVPLKDSLFTPLQSHMTSLQHLSISHCSLDLLSLSTLATACPHLLSLQLSHLKLTGTAEQLPRAFQPLTALTRLTQLELVEPYLGLTSSNTNLPTSTLPLRDITGLTKLSSLSISHPQIADPWEVLSTLTNLTSLTICQHTPHTAPVDPSDLQPLPLLASLPRLVHLEVFSWLHQLNDMCEIASLHHLTHLALGVNLGAMQQQQQQQQQEQQHGVVPMGLHLPKLRTLQLLQRTHLRVIQHLLQAAPAVDHLTLSFVPLDLAEDSSHALAQLEQLAGCFVELQHLSFAWVHVHTGARSESPWVICVEMPGNEWAPLARVLQALKPLGPKLQGLELSGEFNAVDGAAARAVVEVAPHISRLLLAWLHVDVEAAVQMMGGLKNLKKLELQDCSTDEELLAQQVPRGVQLEVRCWQQEQEAAWQLDLGIDQDIAPAQWMEGW